VVSGSKPPHTTEIPTLVQLEPRESEGGNRAVASNAGDGDDDNDGDGGIRGEWRRCGRYLSRDPNSPKPRLPRLIHLPLLTHHPKPHHLQQPETLAFAPSLEREREEWESPANPETVAATAVASWNCTYSQSEEGQQ